MDCATCDKELPTDGDYVSCTNCSGHLHYECAKLSARTWKAMSNAKKLTWKCIECRDTSNQRKGSACSLEDETQEGMLAQLKSFIEEKFARQETLINQRITTMEKAIGDLEKNVTRFLDMVREVKSEMQTMRLELSTVKIELESEKQYMRSRNIQIVGIPDEDGEIIEQKVKKLLLALDKDIKTQDFTAHRLRKNSSNKTPILVQFNNKSVRDAVIRQARRLKPKLSILDETLPNKNEPIFFNDHLTPHYATIVKEARIIGRTKGYKFVWVNGSKVIVKKDINSKPIQIRCQEDLQKL